MRLPGRRSVVPTVASAQIIDLDSVRRSVTRDAGAMPPATLGAVPLSFRQWREELERRSPRFRWSAWTAATAIHVFIGATVLLYASLTTLPEPLPMVAVTLSFEPAKPADLAPTPTVETPPVEASPTVPEPPVPEPPVAEPEPIAEAAATPEPVPDVPPPEPAPIEIPPPLPEPTVAAAPEPPTPVAVAPPPPVRMPPRPKARPPAQPAWQQAQPPQAAAPGVADNSPAASPSAPSPPQVDQLAAIPIIPPSVISAAAGNAKPEYPVAARRRQLEGRLVLRVDVTNSGSAAAIAVAVSSGHPILDQAALDAVRGWRFNPATRGGVPVAGVVNVPIQFRLSE
jgi:protein TonB